MRLAISNIAWDTSQDSTIAQLLQRYSVDAIDIAPGKYFPDPVNATEQDIARVRKGWTMQGIEITGMQALLFGTTGLNVFGPPQSRAALLRHLTAVCRIGAGLGATRIVFGSPKNRDRSGLSDQQADAIAVPFFQSLGHIAQQHDVMICLEPNPECYGANFMTTSAQTAHVVRQIDHPSIRMQLDTGSLTISGENPNEVLQVDAGLIGHIHASERDLLPLGDGDTAHAEMAAAVAHFLPKHIVTVEMLATKHEPQAVSIERALNVAIHNYRTAVQGEHS
jgi:D-psicose/D-tagatose/L-ribulose 3-epimerase